MSPNQTSTNNSDYEYEYYYEYYYDSEYLDFLQSELRSGYDNVYYQAKVNLCLSVLAFLINIFHLIILTRKELRGFAVFIIMITLSICDLLSAASISGSNLYDILTYNRTDYCYEYDSYSMTITLQVINCLSSSSFFTSIWLVVMMAFYRTIALLFPLSGVVQTIMSVKNVIIVIVIVVLISFAWVSFPFLAIFSMYKRENGTSCDLVDVTKTLPDQYRLSYYQSEAYLYEITENISTVLIFSQIGIYIILTILLIFALRKARKRQKNLRRSEGDKKDNTTKLVLAMTLVFLITTSMDPINWILLEALPRDRSTDIFLDFLKNFKFSFAIIQSASHCFICLLMSSQYRQTVKNLLGIKNVSVVKVSVTASSN